MAWRGGWPGRVDVPVPVLMAGEVETAQSNASSQACRKWLGAVPRGAAGEAGAVANPIDRERTVAPEQAFTLFALVTLYLIVPW